VLGRVLFDEHHSVASVSHPLTFYLLDTADACMTRIKSASYVCRNHGECESPYYLHAFIGRNQFCLKLSKYFATFVFIIWLHQFIIIIFF